MSVWTTKSLPINKDYIVLKHTLPGINGKIYGVTFRESYAVIEKNSKTYFQIKRMPVFKTAGEYKLTILGKLPFITASKDIQKVYGKDVYVKYLIAVEEERKQAKLSEKQQKIEEDQKRRELEIQLKEAQSQEDFEKVNEIVSELPQVSLCKFTTKLGTLCKHEMSLVSPSEYCKKHILKDPKLKDFGIEVPFAMTPKETQKFKKQTLVKLAKLKKSGAF
jgi:hypothetical protein